mgnify:CR=1 FL=1
MQIHLDKALVVFDLETTGLDIIKDRIIQLSYIKVKPDGTEERNNHLFNPEKPIGQFISQLTGISDEMVAHAPTFKEVAPTLAREFENCDFAGFNSNYFDIPMLVEEFYRAGISLDLANSRFIDAQTIFHKMEPRNLAAAYKFYCGREMTDDFAAHRADQDTEATYRVLQGQLQMYNEANPENKHLPNTIAGLAEFCKTNNNVDLAGRIVWKISKDEKGNEHKEEVFNFGKHKGKSVVEVLKKEPSFYTWMMESDFPHNTKEIVTRIKLKMK